MRLLLVSHAQTDWNVQGRFQGHTDIPLNEQGRGQALGLQKKLAQEKIAAIVASDLRRARQTAEILALPHGLMVQTDPRLRELHFGDWEGLTYGEIEQKNPHALADWQKNPRRLAPPRGESLDELVRRLREFYHGIGASARVRLTHPTTVEEAKILLVAHRGSLRTLLCLLLDKPVERMWDIHLEIASLSEVLIVAGKATVLKLNEVS